MDLESSTKVNDNGEFDGENVVIKSTDDVEVEGTLGSISLSPVLVASPVTKGRGLKKWRRIHRDASKETHNNSDSNRKRGMIGPSVGMKQSEGSSSSTNAMSNVLGNALDHISVFGDLSSRKGPDFASKAESENSEDQNSRSSTAASVPRGIHEVQVLGSGFNLIGKNAGVLVSDKQEKSQSSTKKPRGFIIRKENSISSMESDSRSPNFVFLQGANSMTSNGRQNGGSGNYDEDDSDDARNGDTLNYASQTRFSKNEGDFENVSHEDIAGENSWEVKEEKIDDHVGSEVTDPLVELIIPLHLAQEALEREVQKLRDVGKEEISSSENWVQPPGFESNDAHLQSKLEDAFVMLELKNTKITEPESTLNSSKIKTEYDDLLTKRIAAEVEYLVISKTIQDMKACRMEQINLTAEQKDVSATAKTTAPAPEEDAKKLKNRVWRYVYCFIIELVLLLVVLYISVLKFSSKTVEVIPT